MFRPPPQGELIDIAECSQKLFNLLVRVETLLSVESWLTF